MLPSRHPAALLALIAAFTAACKSEPPPAAPLVETPRPPAPIELKGEAMGTSWSVKYLPAPGVPEPEALRAQIVQTLTHVDTLASTWRTDSELGRVNADGAATTTQLSPELAGMVRLALFFAERSGGAFDPTVLPLLELWGFGPRPAARSPTDAEVKAVLPRVGFTKVSVDPQGILSRKVPGIQLDLSALGEGYSVDTVGELLGEAGVTDFVVELSGEILARGHRPGGGPWRLGIEPPTAGPPGSGGNQAIALLRDRAMATSGDYRQFRDEGAEHVHHILDPRLGRNAPTDLTSVTVVAPDCTVADALATTVMVMGVEEGVPFAQAFAPGVEVLWMLRKGGAIQTGHTPGFPVDGAAPAAPPGPAAPAQP